MMMTSKVRSRFCILTLLAATGVASGQTITVNTSADVVDFGGAQTIDDLPGPDGKVSLREAGLASDNTPGVQTIAFNVPQEEWEFQWLYPGRLVLTPFLGFRVFETAIVDGTTQTDFTGDTNPDGAEVVVWNTASINDILLADNFEGELRGFDSCDISVSGGSDNLVEGNTLVNITVFGSSFNLIKGNTGGTIKIDRSSDNTIVGNTVQRIRLQGFGIGEPAASNQIGGPNLEDRNYLTGYGTWNSEGLPGGTTLELFWTVGTVIENNWIGTTPDGMAQGSLASVVGIGFQSENHNVTIRNNRIAGLLGHGQGPHHAGQLFGWAILIGGAGDSVTITGNTIGLDANDQPTLGSVWGIDVGNVITNPSTMTDIQIGGSGPDDGNVVAGHIFNGITIGHDVPHVRISNTAIHSNGWLGIDLIPTNYGYGVTLNDAGDVDTGGNGLQNFPVVTEALSQGPTTFIAGTLHSTADTMFDLEFFANEACDPEGHGEGQFVLGGTTVTTDGAGNASFEATLPAETFVGEWVTATATHATLGDTSEFSACVAVAPGEVSCPCLGDFDGDGGVTFADLVGFLDCLAQPGEGCACGDLDGDQNVTFADLVSFLAALETGQCG